MRILLTGSSGLIGKALTSFFSEQGHTIVRLVREKKEMMGDAIYWDATTKMGNSSDLEDFDVVINLAGENVASGRWTEAKKKQIRDSRVKTTFALCQALAERKNPPKVIISASAIGYYGNQGDAILTEDSSRGKGFLAQVCQEWEAATGPALKKGIRVVIPRISTVLSTKGGALEMMLKPFKLGLGGRLGSGKQYMSWVVLEDLVRLFHYFIIQDSLHGFVNVSTPNPVTNQEFTKILAQVLNRPAILPVPEFVLKLALGEMAEELLLSSAKIYPKKALDAGFVFEHPQLEEALQFLLGKSVKS